MTMYKNIPVVYVAGPYRAERMVIESYEEFESWLAARRGGGGKAT